MGDMAQTIMTIKLYGGLVRVNCSGFPTDYDQVGCDGLYIESIDMKPLGRVVVLLVALFRWVTWRRK